jgi:hypothetical protein
MCNGQATGSALFPGYRALCSRCTAVLVGNKLSLYFLYTILVIVASSPDPACSLKTLARIQSVKHAKSLRLSTSDLLPMKCRFARFRKTFWCQSELPREVSSLPTGASLFLSSNKAATTGVKATPSGNRTGATALCKANATARVPAAPAPAPAVEYFQ